MRLDKYLTEMSVGSRSSVKKIIKSGRVYVDGKEVVKPETKIDENASQVMVDGSEICYNKYEYYMLNKPKGCISATNDREHKTVIDIIKSSNKKDLFPVGRLDIDTEGLLLITNNGELAHKLLSPKKHVEKKYYVEVQGILDENDAKLVQEGLDIGEEKLTLPAKMSNINTRFAERRFPTTALLPVSRVLKTDFNIRFMTLRRFSKRKTNWFSPLRAVGRSGFSA